MMGIASKIRDMSDIPVGLCQCGCGQPTLLSPKTYSKRGVRKGDHLSYVHGHQQRKEKLSYTRNLPPVEDAVPFKVENEYCRALPLRNGGICIVSACDYEWLMQWNWHWRRDSSGAIYVFRTGLKSEGLKDKSVAMHRQILDLKHGDSRVGDHINPWNTLDNRRGNLRAVTISQNARNCRTSTPNRSGFKGVHFDPRKNRFRVRLCIDGRKISFGYCRTAEEANAIYQREVQKRGI